jgi:hypothetical protein
MGGHQISGCTEHDPIVEQSTARTHSQTHIKPQSKLRSFVCNAKEHLRDEDSRRKAKQRFQIGVREVTDFVAESKRGIVWEDVLMVLQ